MPLCDPAWVCFQHPSDFMFCSNLFILIVCPYCCVLQTEWSGEKRTTLRLPPPRGTWISCAWSLLVVGWKCLLYIAAFLLHVQWQARSWGTSAILFVIEPLIENSDQQKPGISSSRLGVFQCMVTQWRDLGTLTILAMDCSSTASWHKKLFPSLLSAKWRWYYPYIGAAGRIKGIINCLAQGLEQGGTLQI